MKKTFKEYHQFSSNEFEQLWKECLFVFDTNTLLNMYRYSRSTVDAYFKVLNDLKKKNQLWIPYQVGYEFYENRINVISEFEKSYDEILSTLEKAKNDIALKYKNHPFLDLNEIKNDINTSLSKVESKIKNAKSQHPKWLENDEVLEKINTLFEGNVGKNYIEEKISDIKKEGKERYENKIPPGFKDNKKSDETKYGDLILWFQIIDKAKEVKKPIVLISGDVKEDWWLEKDGKRLLPLPQLKKEISEKAGVDFHIYTSDRFLEYNKSGNKEIDESTIKEVRKIRELEEKRIVSKRMEMRNREKEYYSRLIEKEPSDFISLFEQFEDISISMHAIDLHPKYQIEIDRLLRNMMVLRNRIVHGDDSRITYEELFRVIREVAYILDKAIHLGDIDSNMEMRTKQIISRLERLSRKFRGFLD